jgi:hypothetical protein
MMPAQTLNELTYPGYYVEYTSSADLGLARISDVLLRLLSSSEAREPVYSNLHRWFQVDLSSIKPHFEIRNETSPVAGLISEEEPGPVSEEELALEILEHDYIVKMPPKRRYKIRVHVESIKKGEPRSVGPDDFSVIE